MKKLIAAIMSLIVMIGFTACGNDNSGRLNLDQYEQWRASRPAVDYDRARLNWQTR